MSTCTLVGFIVGLLGLWEQPTKPVSVQGRVDISAYVDAYAQGQPTILGVPALAQLPAADFVAALDRWIEEDSAQRIERTRLAVGFALSASWAASNGPEIAVGRAEWQQGLWREYLLSGPARVPIVAWGAARLAGVPVHPEFDRAWWRASAALLQGVRSWTSLLGSGRSVDSRTPDALAGVPQIAWLREGHLEMGRRRFGHDPRLQLVGVLSEVARQVRHHQPWLEVRPGALRDRRHPSHAALVRTQPLIEALRLDPVVGGAARMHVAYSLVLQRAWSRALREIDGAMVDLLEPSLRAVGQHLRAWCLERLGRMSEAVAAYRSALVIAPDSRSTATRLGALLWLEDERAEAEEVLASTLGPQRSPDLIGLFELGDARLLSELLRDVQARVR